MQAGKGGIGKGTQQVVWVGHASTPNVWDELFQCAFFFFFMPCHWYGGGKAMFSSLFAFSENML